MADLAEVLKNALSLSIDDRAALADRLLASLDEARLRLEDYRAGRAVASEARHVANKAERRLRRLRSSAED